ncbi:hypothetical protein ACFE04_019492 [Oxalis oulophora]
MNTYASSAQSHGPSVQQDEKIRGLARESEEARGFNEYILRKLEHALMQNKMLTDRNEEIRGQVYRLRVTLETQERDNHFMQEAREAALHQLQLIENENARMASETMQQINTIVMLNMKNQSIAMAIDGMYNENQELQNQLGSLQEERDDVMEQYESIKGQVEAMLPKILKIKAKASTLATFICAPFESPFEQFTAEANELLGDIVVDHASP